MGLHGLAIDGPITDAGHADDAASLRIDEGIHGGLCCRDELLEEQVWVAGERGPRIGERVANTGANRAVPAPSLGEKRPWGFCQPLGRVTLWVRQPFLAGEALEAPLVVAQLHQF